MTPAASPQIAAAPGWTYLWLGIVILAFLVGLGAFLAVLFQRHMPRLRGLMDLDALWRVDAFMKRHAPGVWAFIRRRFTNRQWHGLALTVSGTIIFVAVYVFAIIAESWADEQVLYTVDRQVYEWMMNASGVGAIEFMRTVTYLGDGLVVAGLGCATGIFLLLRRHYWRIFALVLAPGVGSALVVGLKSVFERARPETQVYAVAGHSFPSGHSFAAMTMFGFLIYLVWREVGNDALRIILVTVLAAVILLVGASRVVLRVHWVSDVAGGFSVGLAWLVLSLGIVRAVREVALKGQDQ